MLYRAGLSSCITVNICALGERIAGLAPLCKRDLQVREAHSQFSSHPPWA